MKKSKQDSKSVAPIASSASTTDSNTASDEAMIGASVDKTTPQKPQEHTVLPTNKAKQNVDNKPTQDSQAKGRNSQWPMRLGLLLCLALTSAALGASYWLHTQTLALNVSLNTSQSKVQATNAILHKALDDAQQKITELGLQQQDNKNAYQTLDTLKKAQDELHTQLAVLAKRSPNHWMASEADYLTRMAGRKLWLEADTRTAILLLQAADERINAMQNPALLPIRKALSQDILGLQSIKSIDISSNILAIDAIISRLDTLPLNANKTLSTPQVAEDVALSDNISDWQTNLTKSWHAFTSSLVTIRKRTTDIEPLLSPDQQWYLIENIKNKLSQAQTALHQADHQRYHQSLAFADKWLKQYFDLQASNTQEVLEALAKLNELQVSPITHQQLNAAPLLEQLVTYGELAPTVEPKL